MGAQRRGLTGPGAGPGPEGVLKHKRGQEHCRDKKVPLLGQGTGNGRSHSIKLIVFLALDAGHLYLPLN